MSSISIELEVKDAIDLYLHLNSQDLFSILVRDKLIVAFYAPATTYLEQNKIIDALASNHELKNLLEFNSDRPKFVIDRTVYDSLVFICTNNEDIELAKLVSNSVTCGDSVPIISSYLSAVVTEDESQYSIEKMRVLTYLLHKVVDDQEVVTIKVPEDYDPGKNNVEIPFALEEDYIILNAKS